MVDSVALFGLSKAEWKRNKRNKKRLMKQKRKEYKSDAKLVTNSPTWQILEKLEVVKFDDCMCNAEYLIQGQFCSVRIKGAGIIGVSVFS
jgi:hypothetical protein